MLRNYFLIAVRSFKKDRTNALISLAGLVVGLTCVMLIIGYIRYETSFDRSYSNSGRIYQVVNDLKEETDRVKTVNVPEPLAPTLLREIPEIEAQTSLNYWDVFSFFDSRNIVQKTNYVSVDSNFFSMFNFNFKYGNAINAFKKEHSLVLTEQAAQNLFGKKVAIGSIIYSTDSIAYTVTGIIQNIPKNTFFKADAFINHPTSREILDYSGYNGASACIMIGKNNTIQQVENHLSALYKKYKFDSSKISFIPVRNLHLHASGIKNFPDNYNIGDIKYIYVYGSIALLILLIGSANFINLTIARSLERVKEIGVRKVFGAQRKQLIFQFIGESSLYFLIALPTALILATSVWHLFTGLLNIDASVAFLLNAWTLFIFLGIAVVASLLCSLYPAFFLSKLNPVITLKGGACKGLKLNLGLRKFLIVTQFCISIILIISTIIVHTQLKFLNNRNLGFNKNNLIELNWNDYEKKEDGFRNQLLQNSNIHYVSFSSLNIAKSYGSTMSTNNPLDSSKTLHIARIVADKDFIKTLQIPIAEGKDFANNYINSIHYYQKDSITKKSDAFVQKSTSSVILSKKLIDALEIKDPIGKTIKKTVEGRIIGVIDDFKGTSLKETNPLVYLVIKKQPIRYGYGYIKISGSNTQATLSYIEKTWKQFFPKKSFDFSFVDDRIAHLYDTETRLTKLFNIFAFLAIVISCTGLFSLVSLMVRKRTKEIGIRKILGASVKDIVMLISKDFIWLIIISFIIATPLAYIAMNKWLQGYANKTKIYWWIFAIAGIAAFVIAFVSISFKSVAAARANPVDSLRDE